MARELTESERFREEQMRKLYRLPKDNETISWDEMKERDTYQAAQIAAKNYRESRP